MKYKEDYKTLDIREQKHFVTALKGKRSGIVQATVDKKYTIDVEFTSTPCNFGGRRYWFVCQECGGKRLVLREAQNRLLCNSCAAAPYKSASVSKKDRAVIKRNKILKKLGMGGCDMSIIPEWFKPKGMHWKTFHKLRNEYHELLQNDALIFNALFINARLEPFYDNDDLDILNF